MSLTMEKMNEEMSGTMKDQFFGEPSRGEEIHKECAIIGLIKNQMIMLNEELREAKVKFAEAAMEKDNWSARYEREMACKVLEGQISILSKLKTDFENMLSPLMKPN